MIPVLFETFDYIKEIITMMKKVLSFALAMSMLVLSGCASKPASAAEKTPEELTTLYSESITAHGGEMVEYNPVISEAKEEDGSAFLLETMGLKTEDMTAFGISASMLNVQAYGIAAVKPAEGKEEAVKEALQGYIDTQKMNFEFYLVDQYEVANSARLETLEDGTVLMVMCQDQDTVFDNISKAILEQ